MGQQRRFEAFDISFHLLNILKKTIFEEVENKDYLEKRTKKQRDIKKNKSEEFTGNRVNGYTVGNYHINALTHYGLV